MGKLGGTRGRLKKKKKGHQMETKTLKKKKRSGVPPLKKGKKHERKTRRGKPSTGLKKAGTTNKKGLNIKDQLKPGKRKHATKKTEGYVWMGCGRGNHGNHERGASVHNAPRPRKWGEAAIKSKKTLKRQKTEVNGL